MPVKIMCLRTGAEFMNVPFAVSTEQSLPLPHPSKRQRCQQQCDTDEIRFENMYFVLFQNVMLPMHKEPMREFSERLQSRTQIIYHKRPQLFSSLLYWGWSTFFFFSEHKEMKRDAETRPFAREVSSICTLKFFVLYNFKSDSPWVPGWAETLADTSMGLRSQVSVCLFNNAEIV